MLVKRVCGILPCTAGEMGQTLRHVCLSLVFGFIFVRGGVAGPNASDLRGGSPRQSQSPATAATAGPTQTNAAGTPSSGGVTAPDLLSAAQRFYGKGDFDHAIQNYQRVLQETPNSPDAYAGLARVYLKRKDVKEAEATVTKGLQMADSPIVRVALGEVYFRQGKIPDAEREWVNVIGSGREDARAYMGLARVRWAVSMNKSAKSMIDRAHQLDPADPEIRKRWAQTLTRAERIKYLEDYLAGETNDDAEARAGMQHYLEYLKAQARDPRATCHLVSNAAATETALVPLLTDPRHLRGYGLGVAVNGKKSKLLLDTGGSGILINRNLAEKAGVTRLSQTDISGIGDKGNKGGYVGLADRLKIGELEFQGCPVRVLEQSSVTDEDGLLGADVFHAFVVDIDFPNRKLRLTELPKRPEENATRITLQTGIEDSDPAGEKAPENARSAPSPSGPQDRYIAPEMQSYTRVYRFGHNLLVPTSIGDAPLKLFLLDTGSTQNVISNNAAEEVTKVHGDPHAVVKGISGSVKEVSRADKAVIQFGHLRQQNQDLVAFDLTHLSDRTGTEISGILGFATLGFLDIKIDYRDGLVDFSYDPKRWNQ